MCQIHCIHGIDVQFLFDVIVIDCVVLTLLIDVKVFCSMKMNLHENIKLV